MPMIVTREELDDRIAIKDPITGAEAVTALLRAMRELCQPSKDEVSIEVVAVRGDGGESAVVVIHEGQQMLFSQDQALYLADAFDELLDKVGDPTVTAYIGPVPSALREAATTSDSVTIQ